MYWVTSPCDQLFQTVFLRGSGTFLVVIFRLSPQGIGFFSILDLPLWVTVSETDSEKCLYGPTPVFPSQFHLVTHCQSFHTRGLDLTVFFICSLVHKEVQGLPLSIFTLLTTFSSFSFILILSIVESILGFYCFSLYSKIQIVINLQIWYSLKDTSSFSNLPDKTKCFYKVPSIWRLGAVHRVGALDVRPPHELSFEVIYTKWTYLHKDLNQHSSQWPPRTSHEMIQAKFSLADYKISEILCILCKWKHSKLCTPKE